MLKAIFIFVSIIFQEITSSPLDEIKRSCSYSPIPLSMKWNYSSLIIKGEIISLDNYIRIYNNSHKIIYYAYLLQFNVQKTYKGNIDIKDRFVWILEDTIPSEFHKYNNKGLFYFDTITPKNVILKKTDGNTFFVIHKDIENKPDEIGKRLSIYNNDSLRFLDEMNEKRIFDSIKVERKRYDSINLPKEIEKLQKELESIDREKSKSMH